jgi:hypothetical protein
MNTAVTTGRIAEASPRCKARLAGVFEALEGMTSAFGQVFVLGRLVVFSDAAATAANILGHQRLFWWGFVSSLLGVAFHIVWTVLFYNLFKPVNRSLSFLAAFVSLVVCAMQALTAFLYVTPLLVLQGGSSLTAFTTEQLQALALIFLKWNAYAFDIDLVFFGLWCTLTAYLILKLTFLPRILAVLLAMDGLGWMTFVVPPFASYIFPFIAAASALAEIPLQLWLLAVGVNSQRWREQASAAGQHE